MYVHVATDHRGFQLKEELKNELEQQGFSVRDHGNTEYDVEDDYTDYAVSAAQAVARDTESRGIVLCGSGVGVCVTANKVAGVRCVLGFDVEQVRHARERDNCNVLAIPADFLDKEQVTKLTAVFLQTEFQDLERDIRRLEKITAIEAGE